MFQSSVPYLYAAGLPGEFINDGPNRTESFRLVANQTVPAAVPPIAFGVAFTYAALGDVSNPNGLAVTPTATPGGTGTATDVFAGILVNPKEHALYGDANGALDPVYSLPDGSWGELCTMGILLANVTTDTTTTGSAGDPLAFKVADGTIVAFKGDTVPANTVLIPGATLRTNIGTTGVTALAKIVLTTVALPG